MAVTNPLTTAYDSVWQRDREALRRANEALEYWRGKYKYCAKPFRKYPHKPEVPTCEGHKPYKGGDLRDGCTSDDDGQWVMWSDVKDIPGGEDAYQHDLHVA